MHWKTSWRAIAAAALYVLLMVLGAVLIVGAMILAGPDAFRH